MLAVMNKSSTYRRSAPDTIRDCFADIAKGYDRSNTVHSFGMHHIWNQKLVNLIGQGEHLLDLCAGTGEIARRYCKTYGAKATLLDFCPEMLEIAKRKSDAFETLVADAQKIPLDDRAFDAITIAYGIRNVKDRIACFKEVARLLKPEGHFGILELTKPTTPLIRSMHKAYTTTLLPLFGKLLAGNGEAYSYLASSIQEFVQPEVLCKELKEAKLNPIQTVRLAGGAATIIISCPSS